MRDHQNEQPISRSAALLRSIPLTADIRAVFSRHGLEFPSADVGPGEQLVDLAVGVAVDDLGENVGEIAERLDAVELAGLDKRGDDGPVLGTTIGSSVIMPGIRPPTWSSPIHSTRWLGGSFLRSGA